MFVVRPATPADVPGAARVLADAFTGSPWTRWIVPGDSHAERLLALHTLYLADVALPYGRVDVTEIDHTITAAAVWIPGTAPIPDEVRAHVGAAAAALSAAGRAADADRVLAPHRPTTAHVTLASIGVSPGHQGRGVGTATLAAGLRAADRENATAYLETSTAANRRFYGRHGFVVTATVDVPDGGPRTWCMRRSPRRR